MISAITFMAILAGVMAAGLVTASRRYAPAPDKAVDEIESLLPRIECGQCGYPGCRAYASAMLAGEAQANLCPPGGQHTVARLSEKLGSGVPALADSPFPTDPVVAAIDEAACIGCALCLPACPFDAIIGSNGYVHTVAASECTGCGLCVEPCPVDCISMSPLESAVWRPALQ